MRIPRDPLRRSWEVAVFEQGVRTCDEEDECPGVVELREEENDSECWEDQVSQGGRG